MDWGIKVAKQGKNVGSTDPRDYAIWSKYPSPKVFAHGNGVINIPDETSEIVVSITHNLGYVPAFFVFIEGDPGDQKRILLSGSASTYWDTIFRSYADDTKIYIERTWFGPNQGDYKYYFYIFYDLLLSTDTAYTPISNFGLKISKEGKSAESTNPNDLSFNSSWDAFKVWKEGRGSGQVDAVIPHGLNFTPTFLVFCELEQGQAYPIKNGFKSVGQSSDTCLAYSDANNLYIHTPSGEPYYYYIFGDSANEQNTKTPIPDPESFGIKVAKPNKSADSKYIEDLILTSRMAPLKVHSAGSGSVDTGGGILTIPHNLGFTPAFAVWGGTYDNKWFLLPLQDPLFEWYNIFCYANEKEITIFGAGVPGATFNIKYVIFAERGL